ncbi:MAG: hypothetical protein JKY66_05970 [Spongiibacteraceae bacterium]|nr:hypothetical protein [Spongiibacteraceae bacterium]
MVQDKRGRYLLSGAGSASAVTLQRIGYINDGLDIRVHRYSPLLMTTRLSERCLPFLITPRAAPSRVALFATCLALDGVSTAL